MQKKAKGTWLVKEGEVRVYEVNRKDQAYESWNGKENENENEKEKESENEREGVVDKP